MVVYIYILQIAGCVYELGLIARVSPAALHGLDNVAHHVFIRKLLR